jgi:curved DNA-binding protein CbpA
MAAADHGAPGPDLYQLLGITQGASREEIALAWRRRARAEHPDSRPGDADAPGRFRALAEAYQVLGDPGRRAAYDRALAGERQPAIRVTVRRPAASRDEDIGLAVLADLALRYLARDRGRAW